MNISTIREDRNTPYESTPSIHRDAAASGHSVVTGAVPGARSGGVLASETRTRACGYSHKCTQPPGRHFLMRSGGSAIQIKSRFISAYPEDGNERNQRGQITEWSRKSMHRCITAMQACPWQHIDLGMLTLTYPNDYPKDGNVVRAHRRAFMMRLRRRYPEVCGIWKVEFQKRGAPHLHVWVGATHGTRLWDELSNSALRKGLCTWLSRAWYEVVGSEDIKHLRAGTRVDVINGRGRGHPLGYFKGYLSKAGQKQEQNEVPENYGNVGRFWAFFGGFGPEWDYWQLDRKEFYRLRRVLRAYFDRPRPGHEYKTKPYRGAGQGATLWLPDERDRMRILRWALGDEVIRRAA